jgi:hypothetical protein
MRRIAVFAAIVWGLAVLEGCGGSDTPTDAQAQGETQPKAPPVPPEVVTREFLEAIRTGDQLKADSLLTDLAREKTQQFDLALAPSASPTAKYEMGEVEIMEGQVAHVESLWTDIGEDGKPRTLPFVWALRLDTSGWRIGGVASKLFDDAPLLLLNFEDPEDMLRKQAMLEEEMMRRMNGGKPAGSPPGTIAGGANGAAPGAATSPGAAMTAGGQTDALRSMSAAPGSVPPGTLPPGSAMPVGAAPTTSLAPGALPTGASLNGAAPGAVVPASGFTTPPAPGALQPPGAQAMPAPGILPPGAQAQQPLPPGTLSR